MASPGDAYALRNVVGRWLRIRAEHADQTWAFNDGIVPKAQQRAMFQQLANDAEHSELLANLFAGEEPLPFDEWLARHGGKR